jgi:hypothetical protein
MSFTCQFSFGVSISYYSLPDHFFVMTGKIDMLVQEKFRIELKYHRFDVSDVDVFNVFYNTKTY